MYRIGEFSKIVGISVRTLRYYDEQGILKPNETDNFTKYRYYSDENILECELIKLLKSVDFTLNEIILYKNNLDDNAIKKKRKEIEEKIKLLRKKHNILSLMSEDLKKEKIRVRCKGNEEKVLRRIYERKNNLWFNRVK